MPSCSRCEKLPEPFPDRGRLYLCPPVKPTGEFVESYLKKSAIEYAEIHPNILEIHLDVENLKELCSQYLCQVSRKEMADTRCLFLNENESFDAHMLFRMQSLESLVSRIDGEWLVDMLGKERIETWFQPIVSASDPSKVFAYECLMRGRDADGNLIFPDKIISVARAADMMFYLDRVCRVNAIRNAGKHRVRTNVFINFNPNSIYDPEYCLKTTVAAIKKSGIPRHRIVFEVIESDNVMDVDHLVNILEYYRGHGFRVAVDDLGAGYSSLNRLFQLKPDFIKLDMALIRDVDRDGYKATVVSNILNLAGDLGIRVIAEGVERVGEWHWLLDHHTDFFQGYLFAKPAVPPPLPVVPVA